jgi:hypothetical protein
MPARIDVDVTDTAEGWLVEVTVTDAASSTSHRVRITREALNRLAPSATPEALARASFEFLLEREPKESILRDFDIDIISRYFPKYASEIQRLSRGPWSDIS